MEYDVKLTTQAIDQIEQTIQYISKTLLEPKIALKWADTLQREIEKLNSMPLRFPLVKEEPWHSKGIRKAIVKNFLVYYLVDEKNKVVWVTAVIYGRRDQTAALYETMSDEEE